MDFNRSDRNTDVMIFGFSGVGGVECSRAPRGSYLTRISGEFLFFGFKIVPALELRSDRALLECFECLSPLSVCRRPTRFRALATVARRWVRDCSSPRVALTVIWSRTRSAVDPARSATARSSSNFELYEFLGDFP